MRTSSAVTSDRVERGAPEGVPFFIAVDWGTTAFRAYLATETGSTLAEIASGRGILSVADGDFAGVLLAALRPWLAAHGPLPVLMSGMIGSRQGWRDVPYVAAPASLDRIAAGISAFTVADPAGGPSVPVAIVPGLAMTGAGVMPDVMRGEETQVLGALLRYGTTEGVFVLPGTHAKWVTVREGAVASFRTYMTGEIFAALKDHTILGRLMAESAPGGGFAAGLAAARDAAGGPGALLNLVFSARTRVLVDGMSGGDVADYLSGLLIGAEIRDAAGNEKRVGVIAAPALAMRYRDACAAFAIEAHILPSDCAVAGLAAIGKAAGWLKE